MIHIDGKQCDLCGTCVGVCPVDALRIEGSTVRFDSRVCTGCRACIRICPVGVIGEHEGVPEAAFPVS